MENNEIIIVSVFSAALLVLLVLVVVLFTQVGSLRRRLSEMQATGPIRVQKLTIDENDKNHAFHNPTISPDEELSRRGYSMYVPDDVESGRGTTERQTGGHLLDDLTRELNNRQHMKQQKEQQQSQQQSQQQRQHQEHPQEQRPPPFLLQSIQENKRKMNINPVANDNLSTRQSDTNPNFIY